MLQLTETNVYLMHFYHELQSSNHKMYMSCVVSEFLIFVFGATSIQKNSLPCNAWVWSSCMTYINLRLDKEKNHVSFICV